MSSKSTAGQWKLCPIAEQQRANTLKQGVFFATNVNIFTTTTRPPYPLSSQQSKLVATTGPLETQG